MANQQHIEWLLEGVEAWNARREREDFVPDFEGVYMSGLFYPPNRPRHTSKVDLQHANLSRANFHHADLSDTILSFADFKDADCRDADITNSEITGLVLNGTRIAGADLSGANAKSKIGYMENGKFQNGYNSGAEEVLIVTDLSRTVGITQEQLNSMQGDSETQIPSGLKRPDHWSGLDDRIEPDASESRGFGYGRQTFSPFTSGERDSNENTPAKVFGS